MWNNIFFVMLNKDSNCCDNLFKNVDFFYSNFYYFFHWWIKLYRCHFFQLIQFLSQKRIYIFVWLTGKSWRVIISIVNNYTTVFATHERESQVSYVSFSGDVLKFFRKRMDDNNFRYIYGF